MSEQTKKLMKLFGQAMMNSRMQMVMHQQHRLGQAADPHHGRGPIRLLRVIGEHDGMTNTEISELLDIRPSSVSAGLKQLEEQGYIARQADAEDKRRSTVHLTAEGKQFMDGLKDRRDDISEKMFGMLSEAEQKELEGLLAKMTAGLADLGDDFGGMMPKGGPHHGFYGGGPHGGHHHHHHGDPRYRGFHEGFDGHGPRGGYPLG